MNDSLDAFAELERAGWERAAARYESAFGGLTTLFIPALLEAAGVAAGTRVLDVACGPGYVAEKASSLGAEAVGLDFSAEMLRRARARNLRLQFLQGDAQSLDFENGSFDAVVMNFGIFHLPKPDAALSEVRRVLRKNGRFGFTAWAGPEQSPGARIVDDAVRSHGDFGVPVASGPDSLAWGDPDACRRRLGQAGFDEASFSFRTMTAEWPVPTASFLFESERDGGVRTAALLAAQSKEALGRIRKNIEESVQGYRAENGFAIPFTAHVIAASTPALRP